MFENNYIYNDDIENTSNVIWQKAKELLDEILTEAQRVGASVMYR